MSSSDDDDDLPTFVLGDSSMNYNKAAGGTLELQSKIYRVYGLSREVGIRWFEAARYGDLKTMRALIAEMEKIDQETQLVQLDAMHASSLSNSMSKSMSSPVTTGGGGSGAKNTASTTSSRNSQMVMRLLHYNGQGTTYGFIGSIALHWAVANGDAAMTSMLLEKGSSVNYQNNGGSSVLHSACSNGQAAMVKLLLSHGASVTLVDVCGDTAADVVPREYRAELRPLIQSARAAQKLTSQPDEGLWGVEDMKAVISSAFGIKTLRAMNERSELVSSCRTIFGQLREKLSRTKAADLFASKLHTKVMKLQAQKAVSGELEEDELYGADEAKVKGNEAFGKGDWSKAIRYYTAAIHINPAEGTYYSNRCACYLKMGGTNKIIQLAVKDAAMTVKLKPEWVKGYHRLGSALMAMGRYEDSVQTFTEALRLNGGDDAAGSDVLLACLNESRAAMRRHGAGASRGSPAGAPKTPSGGNFAQQQQRTSSSAYYQEDEEDEEESSDDEYVEDSEMPENNGYIAGMRVNNRQKRLGGGSAVAGDDDDEQEEEERSTPPPVVLPGDRKPWFNCPTCENRTRDQSETPCCQFAVCGTCVKRSTYKASGRCLECKK